MGGIRREGKRESQQQRASGPLSMNRQQELGLCISASLHGVLLIGITGWPPLPPASPSEVPTRDASVQVEMIDVSDLRAVSVKWWKSPSVDTQNRPLIDS